MLPLQVTNQSVEEWLREHDRHPTLLPEWPESKRMTIVAVVATDVQEQRVQETKAFVILSRRDLRNITDPRSPAYRLFFELPRQVLLDAGVCPGLTKSSWEDN